MSWTEDVDSSKLSLFTNYVVRQALLVSAQDQWLRGSFWDRLNGLFFQKIGEKEGETELSSKQKEGNQQ